MAKAIALHDREYHPPGWYDVRIDGHEVGWRSNAWRTIWPEGSTVRLDRQVATSDVKADVRWILEQIPGCADLEIEWVNE